MKVGSILKISVFNMIVRSQSICIARPSRVEILKKLSSLGFYTGADLPKGERNAQNGRYEKTVFITSPIVII